MDKTAVKNIIFDLGGVILNLDYGKTESAFIELGVKDFNKLYAQTHADRLFQLLECGKLGPEEFVEGINKYCPEELPEEQIFAAWNAMLLDFPPERIELLKRLKKDYRTFLLSNTNSIHHRYFNRRFAEIFKDGSLDDCFEKAYYSHEIGFRKPNKEAFEFVLQQKDLKPEETLFIDDTYSNIEAAQALSMQCLYLPAPLKLEIALPEYMKH